MKKVPLLKSGWKSSEGVGVYSLIIGAIPILAYLAGIDMQTFSDVDLPTLIDKAEETKETLGDVVEFWQASKSSAMEEAAATGKFGGLLYFVYKVYDKYLEKRTQLKAKALELESKEEPNEPISLSAHLMPVTRTDTN